MNYHLLLTIAITSLYTVLIFLIAWYAHKCKESGHSIVGSPYIYTLSIAVYCTSWTYYGGIGKAATTGLDYIMIYLGPSLGAFSWFILLRRIVRISKENNVTTIADFISLRYGKSQWLGAIVTVIMLLGMMPYIALQIKAISASFYMLSGLTPQNIVFSNGGSDWTIQTGLVLSFIMAVFSVIFGARRLVSSERHEGLIAAVALESVVKLLCMLIVGISVTYVCFNGFADIFSQFRQQYPEEFIRLLTLGSNHATAEQSTPSAVLLFTSMAAFMILPRQFHVMVIENSDEKHILKAMWLFPLYMLLIALFAMPIALGGILISKSPANGDMFALSIPLAYGQQSVAMLAFLGGLSAAGGMVIVESVSVSTMLFNHIFMPFIVRFRPQRWFPQLLINLKRLGIFIVIISGYYYFHIVGHKYSLSEMGMISIVAMCQFVPTAMGAFFWRKGNCNGAVAGLITGFAVWCYTLLLPSMTPVWLSQETIAQGLFNYSLLKPTNLFGLNGLDMWTHCLFWSLLLNSSIYIVVSLITTQSDNEQEQLRKFFGSTEQERRHAQPSEAKRLSKPLTIGSFQSLLTKFIGEDDAVKAINSYLGDRKIPGEGKISEFELPNLKRFTEKTLAASVGAAAASAIVDSFLSDMGTRMESVFNVFSSVKTSLDQSREALYVRLKSSEIINSTLDTQIIMADLLNLLLSEFKLDIAQISLCDTQGHWTGSSPGKMEVDANAVEGLNKEWQPYCRELISSGLPLICNDTQLFAESMELPRTMSQGILSCAHIPISRAGEQPLGVISLYSKSIKGMFTNEFIELLSSLAGQLAQALVIAQEIEAKEQERLQKEKAILKNVVMQKEMEIAQQIQTSLLPEKAPQLPGIDIAGHCKSATHVGGDYYDFFVRNQDSLDLLIADVSGHSIGASLIMAEARTLLKQPDHAARTPAEILKSLNIQLYEDLTRTELFISMFYANYNLSSRMLTYANAGHNPPIILRNGSSRFEKLDADGLIIGVMPDIDFEQQEVELHTGDVIIFYTDGLTEATSDEDEQFGVEKLCSHLLKYRALPASEIIDAYYDAIARHTGSDEQQDDISIIVIKISEP